MATISRSIAAAATAIVLASSAHAQVSKPLTRCAPDAVPSGTVCIDRWEASVWRVPDAATTNRALVQKIRAGRATTPALAAAGAVQLGVSGDDYAPCADGGAGCAGDVYAVSVRGAMPSRFVTWFQAAEACANAGKRLPSSAEWQAAVAGSPNPGSDDGATTCNTGGAGVVATGSRAACVSTAGAFDMVGNAFEWVADWGPRASGTGQWSAALAPNGDYQGLAGAVTAGEPGARLRGGGSGSGPGAGPLSVLGQHGPSAAFDDAGFRCAR